MSPTQRTLAHFKKLGIQTAIVERWNPHARVRQDLFGFIDLVACTPLGIVGIQTTSGSNLSARKKKIDAEPRAINWLKSGGKIVVHGWAKRTKNKRTIGYKLRVAHARLEGEIIVWEEEA